MSTIGLLGLICPILFIGICHAATLPAATIYRMAAGHHEGFAIWIVDGAEIRRTLYSEFVYGGNNRRHPFVPETEIWIDHAISVEEYGYTLAHELLECNLMANRGLTYDDAHDSALALEHRMRLSSDSESRLHESSLPRVSPTDCDGEKEISTLPDSVSLKNIYRVHIPQSDSASIWIVDGSVVRRDIFPDFGFSGNDIAYHFIPAGEIWIDNAMSCEELDAAILAERVERGMMKRGAGYDESYSCSLKRVKEFRAQSQAQIRHHPSVKVTIQKER